MPICTGGRGYNANGCFLRGLQQCVIADGGQSNWGAILDGDSTEFLAYMTQLSGARGKFTTDITEHPFADNIANTPFFRFPAFDVTLASGLGLEHEEGLELAANWNGWLRAQEGTGACAAVAGIFWET